MRKLTDSEIEKMAADMGFCQGPEQLIAKATLKAARDHYERDGHADKVDAGWISVKDRPLIEWNNGRWVCTEDGEKEFLAAVPYTDKNKPGQELWWIRHCVIEDEVGLCVVGDDSNEPSGWTVDAVEKWMPLPEVPQDKSLQETPTPKEEGAGMYYQPLFNLLQREHNLILLESDMSEIIRTVEQMQKSPPSPQENERNDETLPNDVVRAAEKLASKDVRAPKCVRDGLVNANKVDADAISLIAKERREQIEKHGYDQAHDSEHSDGAIYKMVEVMISSRHTHNDVPVGWIEFYDKQKIKPLKERLVIAAALLAAEIDRLSGSSPSPQEKPTPVDLGSDKSNDFNFTWPPSSDSTDKREEDDRADDLPILDYHGRHFRELLEKRGQVAKLSAENKALTKELEEAKEWGSDWAHEFRRAEDVLKQIREILKAPIGPNIIEVCESLQSQLEEKNKELSQAIFARNEAVKIKNETQSQLSEVTKQRDEATRLLYISYGDASTLPSEMDGDNEKERGWISVEDRLPKDEQRVLFVVQGQLRLGSFLRKDQWGRDNMFCDGAFHQTKTVSTWMEAPSM